MPLSVILCTHNAREDYLSRCVIALRAQGLPTSEWELLVVDNRSDVPVSSRVDLGWHPGARIVREETLGLTVARLRAIRESRGELLVFVDDDNVLDPDYLEVAARVAIERPFLGAWSGQCRPGFDAEPPAWTRRYWGNLAIREFRDDVWSNLPRLPATMPCGAGLCVRRAAAEYYVRLHETGQRGHVLDRVGDSLVSGGDNDLAACACDVGLGVGLVAALKLVHLIPAGRLTEEYLCRLAEGIYVSSVLLAHLRKDEVEIASHRVRKRDRVRALLMRGPDGAIQRAVIRGRDRGFALAGASRGKRS